MPFNCYGVLLGRPFARRLGNGRNPHYRIHVVDNPTDFRVAPNVKSAVSQFRVFQ